MFFAFDIKTSIADDILEIHPAESIPIDIRFGLRVIENLRTSLGTKSTTSYRRENKGVVSNAVWNGIRQKLESGDASNGIGPIKFIPRDTPTLPNRKNGNFTFYGQTLFFKNRGELKTTIRLRARAYISFGDTFSDVQRSDITGDRVFLEIKIKNPSFEEPLGVNKFRILVPDSDVLNLFRLRPKDSDYLRNLRQATLLIQDHALKIPENKKPKEVKAIASAIFDLARLHPEFIQPQYATSYFRTSFEFNEKNYPLPRQEKKVSWYERLLTFNAVQLEKFSTVQAPFQLTIDNSVMAFSPQISEEQEHLEIENYFTPNYHGNIVYYPDDSVVIELKEPAAVSRLRPSQRSKTHNFLESAIVDVVKANLLKDFHLNQGKASYLSKALRTQLSSVPSPVE